MSVLSGDRSSSLTAWPITHPVMIVSPKGERKYLIFCQLPHDFIKPGIISVHFLPKSSTSASICERVTPRLSHANSAVVLSAVKVLMKFMEMLPKDLDYYGTLLKKLAPPLVTLLSAEPELQYVALRNINLIVQRR